MLEDGDWLAELVGERPAEVLRAYAIRCLHYAHAQAAWRYRLASWTNNHTYGTDRFHCLCSTLGAVVKARIEDARVQRPDDEFGSPFLIEFGSASLYAYRYGEYASDNHTGISVRTRWLRDSLVRRAPPEQGLLEYPDMPPLAPTKMVLLAWAGNRFAGLERAFFGRPYLGEGDLLAWIDPIIELDPAEGQSFALPGVDDEEEPPRHTLDSPDITDIDKPPPFGVELLDNDTRLECSRVSRPNTGEYLDDDIEEDEE